MKVIVHENPDGTVSVTTPAYNAPEFAGLTEDNILDLVAWKDVPAEAPRAIVDHEDLPSSREQRAAWELKAGQVQVNQAKAAAIDARKAALDVV